MKNNLFILFAFTVLLSSCAQISSLQTAKPLPKGDAVLGASIAAYGVTGDDFIGGDLGVGVLPHLEIFGRYGIANNFDAGLKLSSNANIAIDGKYQFLGNQNSKFAIAIGAAFEYQYNPDLKFVNRQTLPIYFSFHPNDDFALYASPKFIHQLIVDDDNSIFLGGNLGLQKRISSKFSLLVEGSNFFVFDNSFKTTGELVFNVGVGFTFHLQ